MAVTTGLWIFGFRVTTSNQALPFDRAGNRDATLRLGDYTAGQFATEIARAMLAADSGVASPYTCTFSFATRKFTISTVSGAVSFFFEFERSAVDCGGLLGFDPSTFTAPATSRESTVAAGVSFSLTAGVRVWAPTDPSTTNSPITAAADGTTAAKLQRKARAIQNETDGLLRETIHFSTDKIFRIEYRYLSAAEQTNFDLLMDWLETGAPVDFRPDDTAGATINVRLVLVTPGETRNSFSWLARPEVDYPELVLVQQLSRT